MSRYFIELIRYNIYTYTNILHEFYVSPPYSNRYNNNFNILPIRVSRLPNNVWNRLRYRIGNTLYLNIIKLYKKKKIIYIYYIDGILSNKIGRYYVEWKDSIALVRLDGRAFLSLKLDRNNIFCIFTLLIRVPTNH